MKPGQKRIHYFLWDHIAFSRKNESEVFGVTRDPGAMMKRVSACEQEGNPALIQQIDNGFIERDSFPFSHAYKCAPEQKGALIEIGNV
jgi:hypothetical protein